MALDLTKRRFQHDLITPVEAELYTTMDGLNTLVTERGSDKRLLEAIELLDQAATKISDYMDEKIKDGL